MKTALFSACYLEGDDAFGNNRLLRNLKYIAYYRKLRKEIGWDRLFLIDNASTFNKLMYLGGTILDPEMKLLYPGDPTLIIIRHETHFPRGENNDYLYCWRALYSMKLFMENFDKIVTIDSDGFVLSQKLAHYIRDHQSGWETFWCKKHRFPEASFHILNRDAYPAYGRFTEKPYARYNGLLMESTLPFTQINFGFDCDRYGEDRTPQVPGMDFYGQCPVDLRLVYQK